MAQDPSTSQDEVQHLPVDSTETLPLLTTADPEQQDSSISDEEAYAKLKAKRAERRRKKLIRRGIVAGVISGVILIAVVATAIMSSKSQSTNEPVLEKVQEGTFTTSVEAKGRLKPISASVVSPTVDGTVAEINVQAGQQVNVGDVLMTIKNDELDRNVTEAQRALTAAREDLAAAKKALASAQNAPSNDDEGNPVSTDTSSEQSAVSSAQRSVESAQATLDQANARAAERTVKASSSGSIVELNAKVGATVSGGMVMGEGDTSGGKQCMQIADLSKMKVTVQVGEKDIAKIAVGQTANVTYPAFPDIVNQGTVTAIASVASGDSGNGGDSVNFDVDILIDAPDKRLKPGMTAEVSIITEQLDYVVIVPTLALMTGDGDTHYVNLATDETGTETRRVEVSIVTQNDNEAVVGKVEVEHDDQGNEINPNVPVTKLRDGDTLVVDTKSGSSDADAPADTAAYEDM